MTSANRLDKPKWSRVEAGYYVRPMGLHRTLEIVYKNDTPADKTFTDRWEVRIIERRKPIKRLGWFSKQREARAFADEWRAKN